jgi:hypothetical protein
MAKFLGVLVAALVTWALTATAALAEEGRWQQLENKASCIAWNAYPKPNETVTWSGACLNGKAEGRGTLLGRYLQNGEWKTEKYEGEMKDGKQHRRGVLVWASGASYDGEWKDGTWHGRGVYVTDVERYDGEWKDGKVGCDMEVGQREFKPRRGRIILHTRADDRHGVWQCRLRLGTERKLVRRSTKTTELLGVTHGFPAASVRSCQLPPV